MKYTQSQIALLWTLRYGVIFPAKISGNIFLGTMFGSETSKRCRELRALGWLDSHREGKFTVFTITKKGQEVAKKLK